MTRQLSNYAGLLLLVVVTGCGADGSTADGSSTEMEDASAVPRSTPMMRDSGLLPGPGKDGSTYAWDASDRGFKDGPVAPADAMVDATKEVRASADGGGNDARVATDVGAAAWTAGRCAAPATQADPPPLLSQTGCMDARDTKRMASTVIPYEVNSPLWSDGADKERGFQLPAGTKIHVLDCAKEAARCPQGPADDGKWVFPAGAVMIKTFSFDGRLVETRLFVRFGDGTWAGYSYQWNEAQTDATLLKDDRKSVTWNTGKRTVEWSHPSRLDCVTCHERSGGSTLGPETAQMNRVVGGVNQIDRLTAQGLFDAPISKPYKPPFPLPYGDLTGSASSLEKRARSYLHANCSFCHRPNGQFDAIDLRFDVPLASTKVCEVEPTKGDVGVPGAVNLRPGKPEQSVLWLRMNASPGNGRMPQIGTDHTDEEALKLIGDFVRSLRACP